MNTDTPTPRTDAKAGKYGFGQNAPNKWADFARQLERELERERELAAEELDQAKAERHALHNRNAAHAQELLDLCATLRAANQRLDADLNNTISLRSMLAFLHPAERT